MKSGFSCVAACRLFERVIIRNQQVACSSHVTSSSSPQAIQYLWRVFRFTAKRIAYDLCCFLLSPKGTLCVSARLQDPQNGFPLLPLFRGYSLGRHFLKPENIKFDGNFQKESERNSCFDSFLYSEQLCEICQIHLLSNSCLDLYFSQGLFWSEDFPVVFYWPSAALM